MVGRGNDDRIDLTRLQHLAVVLVSAALVLRGHRFRGRQVAVGDRHDLRVTGERGQLIGASTGTDEAETDSVIRSRPLGGSQRLAGDDIGHSNCGSERGGPLDKDATG